MNATTTAHEFNLAYVWQQSDWVIQSIAITLLLMSVASWSILIIRALHLFKLRRSLAEHITQLLNPSAILQNWQIQLHEATDEYHKNIHQTLALADWLDAHVAMLKNNMLQSMQSGMSILASVAATSPFVGLLGTVWGIHRALMAMGYSGQATLDKIAAPVGEALVMTAFGLMVAIPAVLSYNALQRGIKQTLQLAQNRLFMLRNQCLKIKTNGNTQ